MFKAFEKSLVAKFTAIILLMVLLTSLVLTSLTSLTTDNILKEKDLEKLERLSTEISNEFFNFYKTIIYKTDLIARYSQLEAKKNLENFFKFNPEIMGISLFKISKKKKKKIFEDGDLRVKNLKGVQYDNLNYKGRKYLISQVFFLKEEIVLENKEVWEPFYHIKIKEKNSLLELLVKAEFLSKRISYLKEKKISFIIYDKKGKILIHPNIQKSNKNNNAVNYNIASEFKNERFQNFLNSDKKVFHLEHKYRNQKNLSYSKKFTFQKLFLNGITLLQSQKILGTMAMFTVPRYLTYYIIFFFLFSLLGWGVTHYLLSHLNEITSLAQRYNEGDEDIKFTTSSKDEIGFLASSFESMISKVEERKRILRKSERRIREARDQAEQALSSKSYLLEDLRNQKAEIEKVSKDKDELLAIVSHDLKNPLTIIETSMDYIIDEGNKDLDAETSDLVRRSKNSARLALNLITDLLDLSRLEGGIRLDFERFSVDEMIESVIDTYSLKSKEKNIKISLTKSTPYDLIADYGRVIQVISNILGNSLKFTPVGGEINIKISEYQTSLSYEGIKKGLEIRISDNGPGIPQDKIEKIFDKFSQARKIDRDIGTGLGLTICRTICELHNGEIFATSKDTDGATFIIRLPRIVLRSDLTKELGKKKFTIIVANDDEMFRSQSKSIFVKNNYSILGAKNGEEVLTILDDNRVDLIILDEDMPVMSGNELLKELGTKSDFNIPIIFLTTGGGLNVESSHNVHIADVASSEILVEDLVNRVSSILRPERVSSFEKKLNPLKKTILIVDDEEGIRTLLNENFEILGFNSLTAKSTVEALFFIQKYNLDLVITDIRMSEVDGLTLTKIIKKDFPNLPLIILSANVNKLTADVADKIGGVRVFPKPFDIELLNKFIIKFLGNSSLLVKREIVRKKGRGKSLKNISQNSILEERGENKNKNMKKVLLVDDSEDMQALFKVLLRKEQLALTVVSNGLEAFEKIQKENFDVIFMDMNMPVMNGKEAIIKIRAYEDAHNMAESYVVLLTADNVESELEVKGLGFSSYVNKPLNRQKIMDEIKNNV